MRKIVIAFSFLLGLAAADVMAQSHGHSHTPLNQKSAVETAELVLWEMIKKNAVEPSWKEADLLKAERRTREGKTEWVVSFENPKVEDNSKRTLYVFLDNTGHYLAANYSGK